MRPRSAKRAKPLRRWSRPRCARPTSSTASARSIKRGTPARETVDLNEIIRETTGRLADTAHRSAVSIRCELDRNLPPVTADRVQLQQVLINLMLNGIEAMKDQKGELHILSNTTEDGRLLVSTSDTGVGIREGDSERIFEAFFSTKPQGTGIGLSISRRIIEAHGGRLWVTPNAKSGATFQFTLPCTNGPSEASVVRSIRDCLKSSRRVRLRQAIEQSARALHIGGTKAFGESRIDRRQKLPRLSWSVMSHPQTCLTKGDAQFPQQRALLSGQLGGFDVATLRQGDRLDGALLQKYLTFDAKQLGNIPDLTVTAVAGSANRLVYCRQGSIELAETGKCLGKGSAVFGVRDLPPRPSANIEPPSQYRDRFGKLSLQNKASSFQERPDSLPEGYIRNRGSFDQSRNLAIRRHQISCQQTNTDHAVIVNPAKRCLGVVRRHLVDAQFRLRERPVDEALQAKRPCHHRSSRRLIIRAIHLPKPVVFRHCDGLDHGFKVLLSLPKPAVSEQ